VPDRPPRPGYGRAGVSGVLPPLREPERRRARSLPELVARLQHPVIGQVSQERLLREAAPEGADVEVEIWSSSPAGLVPPDSKAVQLAQGAFERVLGRRPLLLRTGGTLPVVPALVDKGIPMILSGFALPGANMHSPNERLLARYVPLGVAAAQETLVAFADLRS